MIHLENLSSTDLLLLQKHIKLGKKHLSTCLSQAEIEAIFQSVSLSLSTKEELATSKLELAGQASLVFNTIFTGAIGFWLGLSQLLHWNLASPFPLIAVLLFSFSMGCFIGFQSIRVRRKMMKELIDHRKLKSFEMQILKMIHQKREKEYAKTLDQLNVLLQDQKIDVSPEALLDPSLDFQKMSGSPMTASQFIAEVRNLLEKKNQAGLGVFEKIAKKLSHCPFHPHLSLRGWIQSNIRRLIMELFPTLFGGAASLFVYIGGFRTETEAMGSFAWIAFLERTEIKIFQLLFVFLITSYFAFTFFILNKKSFKRDQEKSKIETLVAQEEQQTDLLQDRLLKTKECLSTLQKIR